MTKCQALLFVCVCVCFFSLLTQAIMRKEGSNTGSQEYLLLGWERVWRGGCGGGLGFKERMSDAGVATMEANTNQV